MSKLREYIEEAISHGYRHRVDLSKIKKRMTADEFGEIIDSAGYRQISYNDASSYTIKELIDKLVQDRKKEKRYMRYELISMSSGPMYCRFVIFNGIYKDMNEFMVVDFRLKENVVDDVVLYKRSDLLTTWVDSSIEELVEYIEKR